MELFNDKSTFRVKLNYYNIDTSTTEGKQEYERLYGLASVRWKISKTLEFQMKSDWRKWPKTQHIESEFLFSDQWNTKEGYRLWGWNEVIYKNSNIKEGYFLSGEIDRLKQAIQQQYQCGFCGARYWRPKFEFCNKCLNSQYLKQEDLYLLRLRRVAISFECKPEPLSISEKDELLPKYLEAQTIQNEQRKQNTIENLISKHKRKLESANTEYTGMMWFLERNISTENIIYYDHTDTFSIGWRRSLSTAEQSIFLGHLSEFPFKYKIKCDDGQILENYVENNKAHA